MKREMKPSFCEPPQVLNGQLSKDDEAYVPTYLGLHTGRRLTQDVADFYILERLHSDGWVDGSRLLSQLEQELSHEYLTYLLMVVGGEARHIIHEPDVPVPAYLSRYIDRCRTGDRENAAIPRHEAWLIWVEMHEAGEMDYALSIPAIITAFDHKYWQSSGAGGHTWATVARVALDYYNNKLSKRVFIDRCFTLEHNNGCVFDKAFKVKGVQDVLKIQEGAPYDTLVSYASRPVRRAWNSRRVHSRRAYDPVWLGVQEVYSD